MASSIQWVRFEEVTASTAAVVAPSGWVDDGAPIRNQGCVARAHAWREALGSRLHHVAERSALAPINWTEW
jgi:hypothetical protein